ncbi:hypothetical protein JI664_01170 [Rhodobacter sp. NTK016B]|uniref:hypothetical protein n=1 Tax=Rhodobacter sp. NTK016B TaxID=2759676 RepID=UPI001A8E7CC6|nr:hypothetical protein [Rhodobacter sp. NTK016B]MBN8290564.1 hypothetical protein [Rhodobacter sp. NTK016B]
MAEQISLIEAPVYEVTGAEVPRILHELVRFEILGAPCPVRTSAEGDILFLRLGNRDFAVSVLDLAATAALAIEGHLKGEIRTRILGRETRADPADPVASAQDLPVLGTVAPDGRVIPIPRRI